MKKKVTIFVIVFITVVSIAVYRSKINKLPKDLSTNAKVDAGNKDNTDNAPPSPLDKDGTSNNTNNSEAVLSEGVKDAKESEVLEVEKENNISADATRDDLYYVESVLENYSKLYPAVTNRDDGDINVLNTVIMLNSKLYSETIEEIKVYKAEKIKIKFEEFDIKEIKPISPQKYEAIVEEVLSVNKGGRIENRKGRIKYIIEIIDDKVGITQKLR